MQYWFGWFIWLWVFVKVADFFVKDKNSAPPFGLLAFLSFILLLWLIELLISYFKVAKGGKIVIKKISPVVDKIDLPNLKNQSKAVESEYARIKSVIEDHKNKIINYRKRFV